MSELTFEQRDGGVYLVGAAPTVVLVTDDLMLDHDEQWMRVEGEIITFTATNGAWRYRVVSRDAGLVRAERVAGDMP